MPATPRRNIVIQRVSMAVVSLCVVWATFGSPHPLWSRLIGLMIVALIAASQVYSEQRQRERKS